MGISDSSRRVACQIPCTPALHPYVSQPQQSAGLLQRFVALVCRGTPLYGRTMRTSTRGGCTTGYMCAVLLVYCGQRWLHCHLSMDTRDAHALSLGLTVTALSAADQDCWNRPIASAPGAYLDVMERTPVTGQKCARRARSLHLCLHAACCHVQTPLPMLRACVLGWPRRTASKVTGHDPLVVPTPGKRWSILGKAARCLGCAGRCCRRAG